jgi:hypothetical protein
MNVGLHLRVVQSWEHQGEASPSAVNLSFSNGPPSNDRRILTLPLRRTALPWTGPPELVILQGRHKGDVT